MNDPGWEYDSDITRELRIEAMCERVEEAWRAGRQLELAACLEEVESGDRAELAQELVTRAVQWRRQRGETPRVDEYTATLPDYASQVEAAFEAAAAADRALAQRDRTPQPLTRPAIHIHCPHCRNPIEIVGATPVRQLDCPACGSSIGRPSDASRSGAAPDGHPEEALPPARIGHCELIVQLGEGASGTVWLARQSQLDKLVAVKIPRRDRLSGMELERFRGDARAAAQVRHPHVVAVHEIGSEQGLVYIVSDYIEGESLAAHLARDRRWAPREAAGLCVAIAEALHAVHQAGVIHRDLKPSNILLDAQGEPHLVDFGLAKREQNEITMTVHGDLLGTPAYMSPEQAARQGHLADRRADIYSLGTILFELLTGTRPFRGEGEMLLRQVRENEPPRLRRLVGKIPLDLETICLKCREKDPARRYATMRDLSDELGRFLRGEPILARPVGSWERLGRWCRRSPVVAGLLAAVALVLTLGTGVSTWFALSALAQRDRADQSAAQERLAREQAEQLRDETFAAQQEAERKRQEAERERQAANDARQTELEQRRRAERNGYASQIALAYQKWLAGDVRGAEVLLSQCPPDLRHWEWGYLKRLCHLDLLTVHNAPVRFHPQPNSVGFSANGRRVHVNGHEWDADTGLTRLPDRHSVEHFAVVAPPGTSNSSQPLVWHETTWSPLRAAVFSLDRRYLAIAVVSEAYSDAKLDLPERQVANFRLTSLTLPSPRSRVAARGEWTCECAVRPTLAWPGFDSEPMPTLLPDEPCEVLPFDASNLFANHVLAQPEEHDKGMDGEQDEDDSGCRSTISIYETATGSAQSRFRARPTAMVFSSDSRMLAWSDSEAVVHLVSVDDGLAYRRLTGARGPVSCLAWNADNSWFAAADNGGEVHVWDVSTGEHLHVLREHATSVQSVRFLAENHALASLSHTEVRIWDVQSGQMRHRLDIRNRVPMGMVDERFDDPRTDPGYPESSEEVEPSAKVTDRRSAGLVWKEPEAEGTDLGDEHSMPCSSIRYQSLADDTWHPDDQKKPNVVGPQGGDGERDGPMPAPDGPGQLPPSPAMVVPGASGEIPEGLLTMRAALDLSPDGRRLAAADFRILRVWDVADGREILALRGHAAPILAAAFNDDGTRLVSLDSEGVVKLWDAQGTRQWLLRPGDWDAGHQKFTALSADGRLLATTGPEFLENERTISASGSWDFQIIRTDTGEVVFQAVSSSYPNACYLEDLEESPDMSPSGRHVLVGDGEATRVLRVSDAQAVASIAIAHEGCTDGNARRGRRTVVSANEHMMAVVEPGGSTVWDLVRGRIVRRMPGWHVDHFSPDSQRLVAWRRSADRHHDFAYGEVSHRWLAVFSVADGKPLGAWSGEAGLGDDLFHRIHFSHDNAFLVLPGPFDGPGGFVDLATGKHFPLTHLDVGPIDFSPHSQQLVAGGRCESALVLDRTTGRIAGRLQAAPVYGRHEYLTARGDIVRSSRHHAKISLTYSPDGYRLAASAEVGGIIRLWNRHDESPVAEFAAWNVAELRDPGRVTFSRNGLTLALDAPRGTLVLHALPSRLMDEVTSMDAAWRRELLLLHLDSPHVAARKPLLSPDGRWIALSLDGPDNPGLTVYDTRDGTKAAWIPDAREAGAFSPDSRSFAVELPERRVGLWEMERGWSGYPHRELPMPDQDAEFEIVTGDRTSLLFSPDGKSLCADGEYVWDMESLRAIAALDPPTAVWAFDGQGNLYYVTDREFANRTGGVLPLSSTTPRRGQPRADDSGTDE
ncbi:MAG: hypothetical protein FJ276_15525, partial [Planctomycetes bacterium]|nr:hypothetical protein [Planctomycetota bacterium]